MKALIIAVIATMSLSTAAYACSCGSAGSSAPGSAAAATGTNEGGFNPADWVIPTDVTPSAPSEKQYDR